MSFKTIGVIGGGQLGLMIIEAAHCLNAQAICLDPSSDAVAAKVADTFIVGDFNDLDKLEKLCQSCDVITYEFENIKGDILSQLEAKYNIKQGIKQLIDSQDRLREKSNALSHGLKTPKFCSVQTKEDLLKSLEQIGYPAVYKTRTMGYDGHGQVVIKSSADLVKVDSFLGQEGILEEFIAFDFEVSVIMVASKKEIITFPIGKNIHKNGILDLTIVPSGLSTNMQERLIQSSKKFMRSCQYEGILTIEYFIKGEDIFFNEMAPRPHNSGHYTIEGCNTSQYLELCRYLLDLPLCVPKMTSQATIMKNILGFDLENAKRLQKLNLANTYVHLYGKSLCKPLRKMGHVTFIEMNIDEYNREMQKNFK